MKVDWKAQHDKVLKALQELLAAELSKGNIVYRAGRAIEESDQMSLKERGVSRYLRLMEDITLAVEYNDEYRRATEPRTFVAGTLIYGDRPSVYLDDDGDGWYYFPREKLEVVELAEVPDGVEVLYDG